MNAIPNERGWPTITKRITLHPIIQDPRLPRLHLRLPIVEPTEHMTSNVIVPDMLYNSTQAFVLRTFIQKDLDALARER